MHMTPTEKRLFKERVIREYKLSRPEIFQKKPIYNSFFKTLKKIAPLNIVIGTIASIILIYIKGWNDFFILLLSATIWITLISAFISAFVKNHP
ncbi:MAG: hypothetical protein ABII01_03435 [Candidatus Woesearchaeota archaeon]